MTIVTPRAASAIVLLRDGIDGGVEVFMVKRQSKSTFMPDVFVFPGGSVVDADRAVEHISGACAPAAASETALGTGYRAAAIRECFEEAGVLLARRTRDGETVDLSDCERVASYRSALQRQEPAMARLVDQEGLTLATDALLYWAHWITPDTLPVRFDTRFFLAAMPANQVAAFDGLETSAETWIAPRAALDAHRSGDFPLVIATATQLEALTGLDSTTAVLSKFAGYAVPTVRPRIVIQNGVETVLLD